MPADLSPAVSPSLAVAVSQAADYARASRAANTLRAYASDWADFSAWCAQEGLCALPASEATVGVYLAARARTLSVATLARRLASIAAVHREADAPIPTGGRCAEVWAGIRRSKGVAQTGVAPVRTQELRALLATCGGDLLGLRDRALLLVGFAGAFRRSELVALDVADIAEDDAGLTVTIRQSKTDQEGAGVTIGLPRGVRPDTCPARALAAWLDAAGIGEGPVFRSVDRHGNVGDRLSGRAVALVVKRHVEAAGIDPERYAGHSLRAGLATSAAQAGVGLQDIAAQTRHKSLEMVRRYIRQAELFTNNAAGRVGL